MNVFDEYLKQAGLTNQQFAEMVGVCDSAVRHWRTGRRIPRNKAVLKKIAEVTSNKLTPNNWLIN